MPYAPGGSTEPLIARGEQQSNMVLAYWEFGKIVTTGDLAEPESCKREAKGLTLELHTLVSSMVFSI